MIFGVIQGNWTESRCPSVGLLSLRQKLWRPALRIIHVSDLVYNGFVLESIDMYKETLCF